MKTETKPLRTIAYGRSGDKASGANVGIVARTPAGYEFLCEHLTAARVEEYFRPLGVGKVARYELPNLNALNFVLPLILAGGGSRSLRNDAQGKTLAQALLEMPTPIPVALLADKSAALAPS